MWWSWETVKTSWYALEVEVMGLVGLIFTWREMTAFVVSMHNAGRVSA